MTLGRDFRLLWLGRTLSDTGDYVIPAALAIAVVQATESAGALALVLACATVPRLLLLPLGGVVGDRWSPRQIALLADLARAGTQLVIGIELVLGAFRLTDLAVAAALAGAASAFALPTASPLVAGTTGVADRARANTLLGISRAAARVVGPALGGALVLTVGSGWAFLLDAATFAVSAAILAILRPAPVPARSGAGARPGLLRDLADGWSELRRHRWFPVSLVGHATWNLAAAVLLSLGPVIVIRDLGGERTWVALLQAGALGLLVGSLLASRTGGTGRFRLRVERPVLMANLGLALYALPLVLLAVRAPGYALIGGYALALAGLGFLNPVWETAVQQHIPADRLARVSAYDILVSLAAMPLGYALAPLAAREFGTTVPLLLTAVLVFVTTAGTAAVPAVRRLRTEPVVPAPEVPGPSAPGAPDHDPPVARPDPVRPAPGPA
ncbi:MFS transporter [Micromonospora sp. CPCC 206060]|uniref:MFS transporter n=1 Tax=Micromonospora sp. CPCC 206060 TaxID=3122406 RepID=UPI002FF423E3